MNGRNAPTIQQVPPETSRRLLHWDHTTTAIKLTSCVNNITRRIGGFYREVWLMYILEWLKHVVRNMRELQLPPTSNDAMGRVDRDKTLPTSGNFLKCRRKSLNNMPETHGRGRTSQNHHKTGNKKNQNNPIAEKPKWQSETTFPPYITYT